MRTQIWLLAALMVLSAAPLVHGKDLTLHQRTTSGVHTVKTLETMEYWSGNLMVNDDSERRTIVDMDARTFTVADKAEKTYFTQTFDEMQKQLAAMQQAMEKRLENLPPQARELMGSINVNPPLTLKPTGKTEKIAGYDAKEYAIEGGPTTGSIWVSEALQPPVSPEKTEALRKAMSGMPGPGGKLAAAMMQLKGTPLRTKIMAAMGPQKMVSTTEVVEVSDKAAPPEVLKVPEGFKKVAPPSFDLGPGGGPHHP